LACYFITTSYFVRELILKDFYAKREFSCLELRQSTITGCAKEMAMARGARGSVVITIGVAVDSWFDQYDC
jgi:hypothetical protein